MEVVEAPSLKEVHVLVGRQVFSVKVAERVWRVPPRLLLRYARNLLRHAKEHGKSAHLVLVVTRLTRGALRLASRLRWVRIIPYSALGSLKNLVYWVLTTLAELFAREARGGRS